MLDYCCQELEELHAYTKNIIAHFEKMKTSGDDPAWIAPELRLPAALQRFAEVFDQDDLDILFFAVAVRAEPQLATMLEEDSYFRFATPAAWLKLKAGSDERIKWNEQYRFDPARPLFKLGLLSYEDLCPLHLERALAVSNDVYFAFHGANVLKESLLATRQHSPSPYPFVMNPSQNKYEKHSDITSSSCASMTSQKNVSALILMRSQ